MAITYGLTDQGFVNKPLPIIRDEVNAAFRNAFGSSIDLSDRSVLGIIIGIFSERLALLWDLLEAITASQDPNKATGALLEALCAITGTKKPAASRSLVTLALTGTDTTVVSAGSRAQTLSTGKTFETLVDVTITAVPAWSASTAYVLTDRVSNFGAVYHNIQAGTSASSGGPTGDVTETTPDGGCLWTFLGNGSAAVDADAQAVDLGPVFGAARDIAQIATPVGGWIDVTNITSAAPGRDEALDGELRAFREVELANPGSTTFDALRANLLSVTDVTSVTLFANNTDTTDGDGVPPHAVEALIRGGDDQALYDSLLASVAAGIGTHGNHSGTATDSQGTSQAESFSRPVEVPVYVALSATVDSTLYPDDGNTQIADAVVAYSAAQRTGRDAVAAAIGAQAFGIAGVLDVTTVSVYTDVIGAGAPWLASHAYVATPGSRSVVTNGGRSFICIASGTSASSGGPSTTSTDITDGSARWRFLGNNIVIAARELAVFAVARVAITSTAGTA